MKNIKTNFPLMLFSLIPVSVILGSSILLVNIILFGLCFIFFYYTKGYVKIHDTRPVLLLIILYLYLIFNSLISNDITEGFYRNFGFVRFILFFLMTNYLFFVFKKGPDTFKIWTVIFFIVLVDIYIERFTGSNIFGFGKIEIDGVPQPHGVRVVSFLEPNL